MASKDYQEDLKRLVGVDNTQSGIAAQKEKPKITGKRGIAYFQPDGSIGSKSGDTPSSKDATGNATTQPGDAYGGDQTVQDSGNFNTSGGGGGSSSYPGGGGGTSGDGTTSNDIGDDQTFADTPDGLWNGGFAVGDTVNGIGGLKDCATGEEVEVYYTEPPAPDGWTDPNTPPSDNEYAYEAGFYWSIYEPLGGGGQYPAQTAHLSLMEWLSAYETAFNTPPSGLGTVGWEITGHTISPYSDQNVPEGEGYIIVVDAKDASNDPQQGIASAIVRQHTCGAIEDDYCVLEPQIDWPSDGKTTLVYDYESRLYKAHPLDPDASLKYKEGVSALNLCTNDANSNPIYEGQTNTGGSVTYSSTTGIAVFKDENGNITGYGDGAAVTASQVGI